MVKHQQRWVLWGLIMSTLLSKMVALVQVVTYNMYFVTLSMGLKYLCVRLLYLTSYYIRHCGQWKKCLKFKMGHIRLKFISGLFTTHLSWDKKKLWLWSVSGLCVNTKVWDLYTLCHLEFLGFNYSCRNIMRAPTRKKCMLSYIWPVHMELQRIIKKTFVEWCML